MKVNIVTVYQSPNYGSFLQAWALYQVIGQKYDVCMIDAGVRNPLINAYIPGIKRCLAGVIKRNPRYFSYNLNRIIATRRAFKLLKTERIGKSRGVYVFGSDEIWNLSRPEMRDYPVLWGEGIPSKQKMSYAPSLNGCPQIYLTQGNFLKELSNFVGISARDEYSKSLLEDQTGRCVTKVVDPTLLLDKNYYEMCAKGIKETGYIAVYLFNESPEMVRIVKTIAQKLKKRLISVGLWASWCDKCIVNVNPLLYYVHADMVITNTFHGTAFAINLEKQFVTFSEGKSKIQELLRDYDLFQRDVSQDTTDVIIQKLRTNIDYKPVRNILLKDREKSLDYLFSTLREMENAQ